MHISLYHPSTRTKCKCRKLAEMQVQPGNPGVFRVGRGYVSWQTHFWGRLHWARTRFIPMQWKWKPKVQQELKYGKKFWIFFLPREWISFKGDKQMRDGDFGFWRKICSRILHTIYKILQIKIISNAFFKLWKNIIQVEIKLIWIKMIHIVTY